MLNECYSDMPWVELHHQYTSTQTKASHTQLQSLTVRLPPATNATLPRARLQGSCTPGGGLALLTVSTRTARMNVSQDTVNIRFPSSEVPLAKNENKNSATPTLSQCASPNVRKVALKIHTLKPAQAELDILHVTPTERNVSQSGGQTTWRFFTCRITSPAGHKPDTPSAPPACTQNPAALCFSS